jgi:hypothetical protein
MKFLYMHLFAAILGFLPIALLPFDDPALLLTIAILRSFFGLFLGYFIFALVWLTCAILVKVIYVKLRTDGKSLRWIDSRYVQGFAAYDHFKKWLLRILFGAISYIRLHLGSNLYWFDTTLIQLLAFLENNKGDYYRKEAEVTFYAVLLGPVISVPLICEGRNNVQILIYSTVVSSFVWYWWYAGVVWYLFSNIYFRISNIIQ